MNVELKHFVRERPMASTRDVEADMARLRLTRAQLEDATRGHFAAGPHTATVIDELETTGAFLDGIDSRRDAAGNLSPDDAHDYETRATRIPYLLRRLGLYPAAPTEVAE